MFRSLQRHQIVVDVAIAAVFFALVLPVELMVAQTGTMSVLGAPVAAFIAVAIAVVFSAALAIRRWSPPLALILAWAGAVVQMSLGRPPTAADPAIFGALYVAAAYGTARVDPHQPHPVEARAARPRTARRVRVRAWSGVMDPLGFGGSGGGSSSKGAHAEGRLTNLGLCV